MKIINFGSLNLDYVYRVPHFVRPGETLSPTSRKTVCGGKGLNQSVALSRSGANVWHAGCIGAGDGAPLSDMLDEAGVDTDRIDERVVARYPEIRNILYSYLEENGSLDPEVVGDPAVIGGWKFVPEKLARPALKADMDLVFGR